MPEMQKLKIGRPSLKYKWIHSSNNYAIIILKDNNYEKCVNKFDDTCFNERILYMSCYHLLQNNQPIDFAMHPASGITGYGPTTRTA